MKKLKEFYITFDPDNMKSGVDMIALTENPAIELTSLRFTEQKVQEFSFDDYPQVIKDNAARGIRLNEEQGNDCATQVGKVRGQQLANGESISLDTVKRMYSYLSRAKEYYNPDDTEACGTISYLLWGGEEGLRWSKRIVEQQENEMSNHKGLKFSIDKEKQIIAGPAIIPNKKIYRKDESGEYYVIFSQEVIDKMVEKFNSENRETIFNFEHNSDKTVKGFIKGSWVVEDSEKDKSNYYGFTDLPVGTWFIEAKINDKDDWNKIKEMDQVGFSVEGLMGLFNSELINNKPQTFKNKSKMKNKRKFVAVRLATKKMFSKELKRFEEVLVSEEDEVLIVDELVVGSTVEILNEDAEIVTPENGTYLIESDEVEVTVKDGEITSIEDYKVKEEVEETIQEMEEVVQKEVIETPETPETPTTETVTMEDLMSKLATFETRLEELEGKFAETEENEELLQFSKTNKSNSNRLDYLKSLTK